MYHTPYLYQLTWKIGETSSTMALDASVRSLFLLLFARIKQKRSQHQTRELTTMTDRKPPLERLLSQLLVELLNIQGNLLSERIWITFGEALCFPDIQVFRRRDDPFDSNYSAWSTR